ncbi:MAG: ribonuclease P protein component [Polyangiales bacterium]|nr:ribonuclease P protein component [Myxococcales bacterium]MCB9657270.1 ribonuclease P protein component [Sandaracinaceae bacterium]
MTEAYPPSARVRRRADYRRIQSSRGRVHTRQFLIVLASSPVEAPRLGVTVTKKVGNAVTRNRIKRVVREVFRRNLTLFPRHTDLVFIAKQGAERVRYGELLRDLEGVREALVRQRDRLPAPTPTGGAARSGSST